MSDSAADWRHTLTVSGSRTGGYEEKGKDKNGECLDASHYTTTHSEQLTDAKLILIVRFKYY